jgi:hypothetical protein
VHADQVGVVDEHVVDVAPGLELGLHGLDDVALAHDLHVDPDAGDLLEGAGQHVGLVLVGRDRLRHHVDLHAGGTARRHR